jgi:hypothetical protein
MCCVLGLAAILVPLTLVAYGARAVDERGVFHAFHNTSCGEYADDRKHPGPIPTIADNSFIAGWLSAIDWSYPDTYNIAGRGAELDSVVPWLDKFCSEHPLETLPGALAAFVNENYPNRAKRAP